MTTTLDIVDNVADAITRLRFLEKKSKDDDEMIALLKKQKDEMANELADSKHDFGVEMFRMQEERDKDDAEMMALLKKQKDDMANELADSKHNFGVEMFRMQEERDAALKQAKEVRLVIEAVGNMALSGLRKLAGDEIQQPGTKMPLIVKHLQPNDKRLPPVTDEMAERIPAAPSFVKQR